MGVDQKLKLLQYIVTPRISLKLEGTGVKLLARADACTLTLMFQQQGGNVGASDQEHQQTAVTSTGIRTLTFPFKSGTSHDLFTMISAITNTCMCSRCATLSAMLSVAPNTPQVSRVKTISATHADQTMYGTSREMHSHDTRFVELSRMLGKSATYVTHHRF